MCFASGPTWNVTGTRHSSPRAIRRNPRVHTSRTESVTGYRGPMQEVSPDGRMPLLYDYDLVTSRPLALMAGRPPTATSRRLCNRTTTSLPRRSGRRGSRRVRCAVIARLPPGWTRGYVLRWGYCKDADLFTASGDSVGPLPWKGMSVIPTGPTVLSRRSWLQGLSEELPDPPGHGTSVRSVPVAGRERAAGVAFTMSPRSG